MRKKYNMYMKKVKRIVEKAIPNSENIKIKHNTLQYTLVIKPYPRKQENVIIIIEEEILCDIIDNPDRTESDTNWKTIKTSIEEILENHQQQKRDRYITFEYNKNSEIIYKIKEFV